MVTLGRIITNVFKIVGLLIGLFAPHGAFATQPEAAILCFSGFLMAGAQLSEQSIIGLLEKYMGHEPPPEPPKRKPKPRTPTSTRRKK